jgi:RND superfamily putative drug exporter
VGSNYANDFSLPNTESQKALDLLQDEFPSQSGDIDQIVFRTQSGTVGDKQVKAAIEPMLQKVKQLPHVATVVSPYSQQGQRAISKDQKIAFATVMFDQKANTIPITDIKDVINTAAAARSDQLQVELGGLAIERGQNTPFGQQTMIGIGAAMVILFLTFGSLLAMGMPIVTALFGLGTGVGLIVLGSRIMNMADFSEQLAMMIGLGVGVDYALFIVSRYRDAYRSNGGDVRAATELAMNTSGRAILFAGTTVIIALLGLFTLGLDFLYGVALSSSLAVAFVLLASLTLLPAFLSFGGKRLGDHTSFLQRRRARREQTKERPKSAATPQSDFADLPEPSLTATELPPSTSRFWIKWIAFIQRRPLFSALVATILMLALAAPALSMNLGLSDAGNDKPETTTRKAYDLLSSGFGPGFNGPLLIVATLSSAKDSQAIGAIAKAVKETKDVATITPPQLSPSGKVMTLSTYPKSSPQSTETTDLVNRLRDQTLGPVQTATKSEILVGGPTATGIDFSEVIASKLLLFIGVVVLLSALLLLVLFRSLVIPVQAAVMNLLSIGASMGIVVALFQFGWLSSVTTIQAGPIEAWLPVMVFAIVFGLSMDYEVFLVSRIHEEWLRRKDSSSAIRVGLVSTGRVITAAAIVMVVVFASFIGGGLRVIELFGVALASAVFLDAIVVRTILLPAVLQLLGRTTWALPGWLDRRLPQFSLEGEMPEIRAERTAERAEREQEEVSKK